MAQQRSPYGLDPSDGARRYFSQFLGHSTRWSAHELKFLQAIEALGQEDLVKTGEQAYLGVRQLQRKTSGRSEKEDGFTLFQGQEPLTLPDLTTAFYATLVNSLAREMELDTPATVRGLPMAAEMPGLPSDHLTLIGRFGMDAMQGLKAETTFGNLVLLAAERLGSLVELAAQSMMGADVDPFETFEHEDCSACGHLLQRHVGFESWEDVREEHGRWCPGARGR